MKKIIIILALIIAISCGFKKNNHNVYIPSESIRLRIISNSNNEIDIAKKLQLKNKLEDKIYEIIKDSKSLSETRALINNNLELLNQVTANILKTNDYKIDYGTNYFPRKTYKGVIYSDGYYESLVITIGKGEGSNWWCVLFPPLCLLEENDTTNDVEYQFLISRIIEKFK